MLTVGVVVLVDELFDLDAVSDNPEVMKVGLFVQIKISNHYTPLVLDCKKDDSHF